jgi:hypothetical protein
VIVAGKRSRTIALHNERVIEADDIPYDLRCDGHFGVSMIIPSTCAARRCYFPDNDNARLQGCTYHKDNDSFTPKCCMDALVFRGH